MRGIHEVKAAHRQTGLTVRSVLSSWHASAVAFANLPESAANAGLVLAAGYGAGLAFAYAIAQFLPVSSGALEEARRNGVVSLTTLNGYAKAHEWTIYLVSECTVILTTIATWWGWCLWSGRPRPAFPAAPGQGSVPAEGGRGESSPTWGGWSGGSCIVEAAGVAFLIGFVVFDINRLGPYWRDSWTFLSEEGFILASVDSLLRGKILYQDDFAIYAPLMIYPLKWLMQFFRPSVMVLRVYFLVLDCLGLLLLYYSMRLFCRDRRWAFLGLGFFLVNFSLPYMTPAVYRPSIHESVLRFSLGLAWLLFYLRTPERPLRRDLLATGLVLGFTLAFSHEVGLVSCLAFLVLSAARAISTRMAWGHAAREVLTVGVGSGLVLVPVLAFFWFHGSLQAMLHALYRVPADMMLGYGAFPFPTPSELWGEVSRILLRSGKMVFAPEMIVKAYWVPWMISVGAVVVAVRLLSGHFDREDWIVLALTLMAGMLFRSSMRRPGLTHFQMSLVPAVVAGLVLLRRFAHAVGSRAVPRLSATFVLVLPAALLSLLALLPAPKVSATFIRMHTSSLFSEKFRGPDGERRPVAGIRRAEGIWLPTDFAREFEEVTRYVATHTLPDEPIIAFPNESAYYFFTDRPNASRYPMAYVATRRDARLEMVSAWQKNKPRYVIYSLGTWRVDDIPERLLVPELYEYLQASYAIQERIGDTLILRRRDL